MAIEALLGTAAGQTGANAVSGFISGAISNYFQKKSEQRAWERTNEMYDKQYRDNSPLNRLRQLKEAGLSPALMYANGGSGGGAATGVMSSASNINTNGNTFDIMSARVQEAQLKNIEANTENIEADTAKKTSETKTIEEQRDIMIENLYQQGLGNFLNNVITRFNMQNDPNDPESSHQEWNKFFGDAMVNASSGTKQALGTSILKTMAETGNLLASEALTNEKAAGYFTELLIAQQNADSNTINAIAHKLTAEFSTGVFTNWKTWVDLGLEAGEIIMNLGLKGKKLSNDMKPKTEIPKPKYDRTTERYDGEGNFQGWTRSYEK